MGDSYNTRNSSIHGINNYSNNIGIDVPTTDQYHHSNVIQPSSPTDLHSESSVSSNELLYTDSINKITQLSEDDQSLAKQGYKAVLARGFNGLMNFSFCFTAVATVSSITSTYTYGLATGGPVVIINGWIICSFFTILIGSIMAEICSVYPNAGSVYYWSGMLAPRKYAPFASFVTGWFNLLGNAAGDASYCFAVGTLMYEMLSYAYPNDSLYGLGNTDPGSPRIIEFEVAIGIGMAVVWGLINCLPIHKQGWVNNAGAMFQVSVVVVVISVLFGMSNNSSNVNNGLNTSSFVWTTANNETGFNDPNGTGNTSAGTMVYLSCIGLLTSLFSFSGYEAGGHLAEETTNANRTAPKSILYTCIASAATGFVFLLALLYNTFPDSQGSLSTQDPVTIFINVLGMNGGLTLAAILLVNFFFSGIASLTVTTRVMFAMARDGAVPFGRIVAYVHPTTKAPLVSVLIVAIFDIALICITLGATQAFYAITGLTTIGYQISYAIPIALRLFKSDFVKGVIHLGPFSEIIGWISVIWLIVTSIFFFWPTAYPVNEVDMNYTVVVVGAVFIFSMIYWLISARHFYVGPIGRHEEMQARYNKYLSNHHVVTDHNKSNNDMVYSNSDDKQTGDQNGILKIDSYHHADLMNQYEV